MPSQVEGRTYPAEAELIRQAVRKDEAAIRAIIQQHNRRLYRVARSIVRDDADAEDVLQEAYLHAFSALAEFRGEAALATWLTRIVVNEALQRLRRRVDRPVDEVRSANGPASANVVAFPFSGHQPMDPECIMAQREMTLLVAKEIDKLPDEFRTVLVARVLEDMSIDETADALDLLPETVKTRLHRARRLLRAALMDQFDSAFADVFPFDGARCDRMTETVIARLNASS